MARRRAGRCAARARGKSHACSATPRAHAALPAVWRAPGRCRPNEPALSAPARRARPNRRPSAAVRRGVPWAPQPSTSSRLLPRRAPGRWAQAGASGQSAAPCDNPPAAGRCRCAPRQPRMREPDAAGAWPQQRSTGTTEHPYKPQTGPPGASAAGCSTPALDAVYGGRCAVWAHGSLIFGSGAAPQWPQPIGPWQRPGPGMPPSKLPTATRPFTPTAQLRSIQAVNTC